MSIFIDAMYKGLSKLFGNIKTWFLISEALDRLVASQDKLFSIYESCSTNIDLTRGHLASLNEVIHRIDEYGSRGAQKSFDILEDKLEKLDSKLDDTKLDVARLQALVKTNGSAKKDG